MFDVLCVETDELHFINNALTAALQEYLANEMQILHTPLAMTVDEECLRGVFLRMWSNFPWRVRYARFGWPLNARKN